MLDPRKHFLEYKWRAKYLATLGAFLEKPLDKQVIDLENYGVLPGYHYLSAANMLRTERRYFNEMNTRSGGSNRHLSFDLSCLDKYLFYDSNYIGKNKIAVVKPAEVDIYIYILYIYQPIYSLLKINIKIQI